MSVKFLIKGKPETNISEAAKEWFYEKIKNGKPGPFFIDADYSKKIIRLNKYIEPDSFKQQGLF